MRDVKNDILKFWFDETDQNLWFQSSSDFDSEIENRFENDYKLAVQGLYDEWVSEPRGTLALIILLDQFPRNMYRGTPKAFASDDKALSLSQFAIKEDQDTGLSPHEKMFLYMPFQHSEDLEIQEKSIQLFKSLNKDMPQAYDYAIRHYDVINEFGRFPHRNTILGRQSTSAEKDYLKQPDSGF